MYKYEAHLHTNETSKCGHVNAADQVKTYKENGYTGICVTDHLNVDTFKYFGDPEDWKEFIDKFLVGYHNAKKAGEECGLEVILGIELRFPENNNDYLVYGIDEQWLYDHPFVNRMSHKEFFNTYGNEVLIIHAHPYRENKERFFDSVHGLEVVNCNPRHDSDDKRALQFALNNPRYIRTCGSDAHQIGDECRAAMLFDKVITNSYEYKEALEKGQYKMWCPTFENIIKKAER